MINGIHNVVLLLYFVQNQGNPGMEHCYFTTVWPVPGVLYFERMTRTARRKADIEVNTFAP